MLSHQTVGRVMVTSRPPESRLRAVISPPCSSAIRLAMGRPRPVPASWVEKNGSKILFSSDSSIPGPSSPTTILASPALCSTNTSTWPPFGAARRAFSKRLRTARPSSLASKVPSTTLLGV